jgi:pyrimidine operon attenuation protein / uracil phosphoribosyltransferase
MPTPSTVLDARGMDRTLRRMADQIVEHNSGTDQLVLDDLQTVGPRPVVGATTLPWTLDDQRVVIVDDVLYTGRTVRAALDELADFGRPARIALAVLIDRGGRELPIHADVVGRTVDVPAGHRVDVLVDELDGRDEVIIAPKDGG